MEGIRAACEENAAVYEIFISKAPGDVQNLASEAIKNGFERIYAVGGDGTLSEASNAVLAYLDAEYREKRARGEQADPCGGTVSLVPIACGTGNDFVRSLTHAELYAQMAKRVKKDGSRWKEYISAAIKGKTSYIDCVRVNEQYFINVASLGMDARIAHSANVLKKRPMFPGSLAYLASVVSCFIRYTPFRFTVSYDDGEPEKGEYTLVAVANGRYYGGGMLPVPKADLHNGRLDICTADKVKRYQVLGFFPKYAKGRHENISIAKFRSCKKISIESEEPVYLNTDGEITEVTRADFALLDFKLPIVELAP